MTNSKILKVKNYFQTEIMSYIYVSNAANAQEREKVGQLKKRACDVLQTNSL